MATKLDKSLKRELDIDGKLYTLTLSPTGLLLTEKGHRKGVELTWKSLIGGLVIATIANGLGLLNQASYINFLVTGGVLLLAASVDAISRRRRSATGLG